MRENSHLLQWRMFNSMKQNFTCLLRTNSCTQLRRKYQTRKYRFERKRNHLEVLLNTHRNGFLLSEKERERERKANGKRTNAKKLTYGTSLKSNDDYAIIENVRCGKVVFRIERL